MKTLVLSTLALAMAVASPALASNCGGGNKGGHRGGNYGGNRGHVVYRSQTCNTNYGGNYLNTGNYYSNGPGYEPFHSYCFVQPGDTFYQVSLKEYGTSAAMQHIARYNRLSATTALVPGQRLMLPSISSTGVLSASRAPAPQTATEPTPKTGPTPKFAQPQQAAASAAPATGVGFAKSDEAALPSVSVGSTISLDGVPFGEESGSVRVKLGPVSVPATVLEWTAQSVKVQLPSVDLESATPASIDVFRADGELASQSQVKLTPAGTQVVRAE